MKRSQPPRAKPQNLREQTERQLEEMKSELAQLKKEVKDKNDSNEDQTVGSAETGLPKAW